MAAEGMGFVLAVAGLFSSCVDACSYFKAGQNFEQDYEILLVKLDIEKTRLLCWGNTVGILDDIQCLKSIERLLTDSEELRKSYGVKNATMFRDRAIDFLSSNNMSLFSIAYSRFRARHALGNHGPTVVSRTKWAVYDQNKFEHLINNLKNLIDGLYEILHLDREIQDSIIVADIGLVRDLSQLRLLDAASEGSYVTYSDAAKSLIAASETGTADNRTVEERLGDVEALNNSSLPAHSISGGLSSTSDLELETCVKHIVLTDHCEKTQSGEPCDMTELGGKSMNNLANILRYQGKLEEVAAMLREVLKKRQQIIGDEHPDTILAMNYLAAILGAQGNLRGLASNLENYKDTLLVSQKSKKKSLLGALLEKLRFG